ncbi:hypothetical protein Tco_0308654 [Tanacetum coccineum]
MSLKQPQLTTTKETPVIEPRFQIKFDLPVFLPLKNIYVQNQGNNQNRYNQNRGNFNQAPAYQPPVHQGQIYRPQVVQPPAYQALAYQAPAPQIQGVSKEDFQAYVKANDAVMRNMQTQGQNMQNQLTNLTDMLSKFLTSNTASTSGTLPSNTVTNPKEDLKGITTRSGVAYKGPTIPITSSPKVVEREPEVTKDTMPPTNNGSTEDIPPPVVPVVRHESISEPVNAPVRIDQSSEPNRYQLKKGLWNGGKVPCFLLILEAITFNLDKLQALQGHYNHNDSKPNWTSLIWLVKNNLRVLGFSNVISSGNPTPYYDPIVSTSSPTLTPFGDSDFLLFEEADSFLAIEDGSTFTRRLDLPFEIICDASDFAIGAVLVATKEQAISNHITMPAKHD